MSPESFIAPEPEQLAELLPAYDFQFFIAQGGMGAVYKAVQRSLDRDVAIKILPREFGDNADFRDSFETEAKAMAKLNHPNLLGVYDFGAVDGMPFIAMEYVDGKSLYHSSWGKIIDPQDACRIVKGICDGLAHAHEAGVIHRDIKPANILLTSKAEPKIGDFGLALAIDQKASGLVMGTPGYAAPEFLDNHSKSDHRADIYAVGVILHELLTGERADGEHPPQESTGDTRLDMIWRKATQSDPAHRFQHAAEMSRALDDWLRVSASRPAARKLVVSPPATHAPVTQPKPLTTARPGQPASPASPAVADPSAPPAPNVHAAGNWSLLRNLLFIAVLLFLIGFAYKVLTKTRADREVAREQQKGEQFEAQMKAEAERRARERNRLAAREQPGNQDQPGNRATSPAPDSTPPPPEETTADPESPMDSLARLRTRLKDGERAEMPVGTVRRGRNDYFLASEPMGWHRAAAFAEDHGGHLALVENRDDLIWLSEFLPRNETAWVGAGRASRNLWVTVSGNIWSLDQSPVGSGDFVSIDSLGLIRARNAGDKFPFVIQWRRDGSNPASLAAMLRRTRETLDNPSPIYPPGTKSFNGRHFAIITRSIDRLGAHRLAKQAGGHLAVPATRNEADWLSDQASGRDAPDGLWLGGEKLGGEWAWITGETWDHEAWGAEPASGREGHDHLLLVPEAGWIAAPEDHSASGFVIEWSDDARKSADTGEDIAATDGTLGALNQRATEVLAEARQSRDKRLKSNVDTFLWDLNIWSRGLNPADASQWTPHVEGLKEMIDGNRVPAPSDFTEDSSVELSEQMAKIADYGFKKQQEIDAEYRESIARIRDAYVERLRPVGRDARDSGNAPLAQAIAAAIEAASDDAEAWAEQMLEE